MRHAPPLPIGFSGLFGTPAECPTDGLRPKRDIRLSTEGRSAMGSAAPIGWLASTARSLVNDSNLYDTSRETLRSLRDYLPQSLRQSNRVINNTARIPTMNMINVLAVVSILAMVEIKGARHAFIFLIQEPMRERGGSRSRSIRGPRLERRSFARIPKKTFRPDGPKGSTMLCCGGQGTC